MLLVLAVLLMIPQAQAAEFRGLKPLAAPARQGSPAVPAPLLDRTIVAGAVDSLARRWNGRQLGDALDESFYDRLRLLDAVGDRSRVPSDAALRVLSVQGVQPLDHQVTQSASGEPLLVGTISATLSTQVEFEDPTHGFLRVDGINEVILEIVLRPVHD